MATLVVIGDSNAAGSPQGEDYMHRWPAVMARALCGGSVSYATQSIAEDGNVANNKYTGTGWTVYNMAVGGESVGPQVVTTDPTVHPCYYHNTGDFLSGAKVEVSTNLTRFHRDVIDLTPGYAIMQGGVNDLGRHAPVAAVANSVTYFIVQCARAGIIPIVCTVPPVLDSCFWSPADQTLITDYNTWVAAGCGGLLPSTNIIDAAAEAVAHGGADPTSDGTHLVDAACAGIGAAAATVVGTAVAVHFFDADMTALVLHEFDADMTALVALPAAGTCGSISGVQGAVTNETPAAGSCGSASGAQGAVTQESPATGTAGSKSGAQGSVSTLEMNPATGICGSISGTQGAVTHETPVTGLVGSVSGAQGAALYSSSATGQTGSNSGAQGAVLYESPVTGCAGSTSGAYGAITPRMLWYYDGEVVTAAMYGSQVITDWIFTP